MKECETPSSIIQNLFASPHASLFRGHNYGLRARHTHTPPASKTSRENNLYPLGQYWVISGLYWDNRKENGNYRDYQGYIQTSSCVRFLQVLDLLRQAGAPFLGGGWSRYMPGPQYNLNFPSCSCWYRVWGCRILSRNSWGMVWTFG